MFIQPVTFSSYNYKTKYSPVFGNKFWYSFSDIQKFIENSDIEALKKVKDLTVVNGDLDSLLHISAKFKNVNISEFLVKNNLSIDIKNKRGQSPFSIACQKSDIKSVKMFLKYKPDVNTQDILGDTPLHKSLQNPELIELLLKNKANPYILNDEGNPVLHVAADYSESFKKLLDLGVNPNSMNEDRQTLIHIAAMENNYDLIEKLLQYKAEINFVDKYNRTALFYTQDPNMLMFLLEKGANPNIKDINNKTPLLLTNNNLNRLVLLSKGADPNILTSQGETLLHMCSMKNNLKVAKTLLSYDADVNALDKNGKTPLYYAKTNEMRKLLLEMGANPDENLYLHYAVIKKDDTFFELLLKNYANPNLKDKFGRTPVYYCFDKKHINKLIEKKADIEALDNYGNTPLMYYSAIGRKDLAEYLIQHGADTGQKNIFNKDYKELYEDFLKYNSWIRK